MFVLPSLAILFSAALLVGSSQLISLTRKVKECSNPNLNALLDGELTNNLKYKSPFIDLTNFKNVQYFGTIFVGSPKQPFKVMFDTGSYMTWIPGPNDTDNCGSGQRRFDPRLSRSFVGLNRSLEMLYLEGENLLDLATETVTVGDLTVRKQTIGLSLSGDCQYDFFDGIMGMSFSYRINETLTMVPIFETMLKQHLLPSPLFSFYLNRVDGEGKGGELYLGGYNPEYVDLENVRYVTLLNTTYPYWIVPVNLIYIGTRLVCRNTKAILDTGTSYIIGPAKYVEAVEAAIEGAIYRGILTVECSRLDAVPPLIFDINGTDYSVTMRDILFNEKGGVCYLGLGIRAVAMADTWLLGSNFLSRVYTIHDYLNRRVALVPLRHPFRTTTEPPLPPLPTPSSGSRRIDCEVWSSAITILSFCLLASPHI